MTTLRNSAATVAALVAAQAFVPEVVFACPSCYGAADSSMTAGMNMGILSLLAVTGVVLTAFAAFFLYLRKRSQELNDRFSDMLN